MATTQELIQQIYQQTYAQPVRIYDENTGEYVEIPYDQYQQILANRDPDSPTKITTDDSPYKPSDAYAAELLKNGIISLSDGIYSATIQANALGYPDYKSYIEAVQGPGTWGTGALGEPVFTPSSGIIQPFPQIEIGGSGLTGALSTIGPVAGFLLGIGPLSGLFTGGSTLASGLTEGATLASDAGFLPGSFELGTSSYGGTAAAGLDAATAEALGGIATTGTNISPYDFFNETTIPASGEEGFNFQDTMTPQVDPITQAYQSLGETIPQTTESLFPPPIEPINQGLLNYDASLPPSIYDQNIGNTGTPASSGAGTAATLGTAAMQGDSGGQDESGFGGVGTDETAGDLSTDENTGGLSPGLWERIINGTATASDWMKIAAPLLGGGLGYLSGQEQGESDYDFMKPYITAGLDTAKSQLGQTQLNPTETSAIQDMLAKLTAPNTSLDAANQTMTDTASGKYLDLSNNPVWQRNMDLLGRNYNEVLRPGTDSAFSRANAFGVGNSAWEEYSARNARALAEGQGAATAGAWNQERANQLAASQGMPDFQNKYLTGLGKEALQLGNYQRTQPWTGILNYGNMLAASQPRTGQQQNTNPWMTALGGALTGSSLYKMWS
jgi:hypothetical protein